jgi:hypothetical protein
MGLLYTVFVLRQLAGLHERLLLNADSVKIFIAYGYPRVKRKILCLQRKPVLFGSLEHTSNDTPELDHGTGRGVNSFTPNRLILMIFNKKMAAAGRMNLDKGS